MIKNVPISQPKYLVLAMLICAFSNLRGQTMYALKIDGNIRLEAKKITAQYQPRLVMGVDQALEFQSTVARYLVKKQAVEQDSNLSPKAKYDLLKRLSSLETSEMINVLEPYRWKEYIRIKAQFQPIPEPFDYVGNEIAREQVGID
ncbi:hypothetical protein QSE00_25105 [Arenibacter sp. M-2]|uniref:hypothetical protein n=1 Tax=Arenibacter sp. M-2 TaxID=3053612 RepID=UPI002570A04D|nr:hypothetical protein [Arenibacter sp. M-2]MDL5515111.1 hypothetical protein [Arenibacter sp. M-2]|tara:strand:+ start:61888 stop:62325 length:438 start_codon:yes stop_codon:yes gene_type:complete